MDTYTYAGRKKQPQGGSRSTVLLKWAGTGLEWARGTLREEPAEAWGKHGAGGRGQAAQMAEGTEGTGKRRGLLKLLAVRHEMRSFCRTPRSSVSSVGGVTQWAGVFA